MSVSEATRPAFFREMMAEFKSATASTYILYGNVKDYVEHPEANEVLRNYLTTVLSQVFTVAVFSPHEGITFGTNALVAREAQKRFDAVLGFDQQGGNEGADLYAAAGGGNGAGEVTTYDRNPVAAIPLMAQFAAKADRNDGSGKRGCIVIDNADLIVPPADKAMLDPGNRALLSLLASLGRSRELDRLGGLVIILAPSLEEVHPDLRLASNGIRAIEIPPPSYAQRLAYIQRVVEAKQLKSEVSLTELAAATAGLGFRHIEDLALRAKRLEGATITRTLVRDRKAQMIASEYAGILEVLEPDIDWDDLGGCDRIKDWFEEELILALQDEDDRDDLIMGAMLAGPAGTGKTVIARAVAKRSGLNCILLRPENIKGQFVGESERKTALAIKGIKAMSPAIVFVDEVDQRFRRGEGGASDGGSAVENNIFGRLLEFFGDTTHRGEVILLAATNRPDLVDSAFKRPGRIDAIIPVLPPDSNEERADVITRILKRIGATVDAAVAEGIAVLAARTDGYTPAELEGLVIKGKRIAKRRKLDISAGLLEALRRTRNRTTNVRDHTMKALAECDDIDLVPVRWQQFVGQKAVERAAGVPAGPDAVSDEPVERTERDIDL
jgi:SpoVK/Ycf46/Vps4 family AAA+-type ATPase